MVAAAELTENRSYGIRVQRRKKSSTRSICQVLQHSLVEIPASNRIDRNTHLPRQPDQILSRVVTVTVVSIRQGDYRFETISKIRVLHRQIHHIIY